MKEKKYYEISLYGQTWRVALYKAEYEMGGLAIEMITDEGEDFATLTVNLGGGIGENEAFIDTNNCSWAEEFLKKNKIARPTGETRCSGFCTYPLYRFDEKVLNGMPKL